MGIIILTGLLFSKITKALRLPNVTGYLVGGLLIGPIFSLWGWKLFPESIIEELGIIPKIALGFIAFTIGTEFKLSYFKRVGAKPIIIAAFESLFAILAVFIVLILMKVEIKFALVLSSIAAATAPAATLMVIKQYRAKGEVTENLMSVVAIDDATAIIFFGIFVAIAQAIGSQSGSLGWMIAKPFVEIISSLAIGFLFGIVLSLLLKWFTGRSNRISVIVALLFIVVAMADITKSWFPDFDFSTLLACMMIGAVFTNTTSGEEMNTIMYLVDRYVPPIFILFFVISGIDLNLTVLTTVGIIGTVYVIMRVVGKVGGAYLGAVVAKSSHAVRKYLGWALVPQAGVAIGLTVVASSVVPHYAQEIRAVVLTATLIYELAGPLITKTVLKRAKEIAE